jgi:hypothetical protein
LCTKNDNNWIGFLYSRARWMHCCCRAFSKSLLLHLVLLSEHLSSFKVLLEIPRTPLYSRIRVYFCFWCNDVRGEVAQWELACKIWTCKSEFDLGLRGFVSRMVRMQNMHSAALPWCTSCTLCPEATEFSCPFCIQRCPSFDPLCTPWNHTHLNPSLN